MGVIMATVIKEKKEMENTARLMAIMENLSDHWVVKAVVSAVVSLFVQDPKFIVLIFILVFLDTATGVVAALKRGDKISARKFGNTSVKLLLYLCLVLATVAVANAFPDLLGWLDNSVFMYVCLTELFSVFENVSETNEKLRDFLAKIKDRIMGIISDDNRDDTTPQP